MSAIGRRSVSPHLDNRSGGRVSTAAAEGVTFVAPEGYALPPTALRAVLAVLVRAASHHTETAAG